jgi:hypothetical protein
MITPCKACGHGQAGHGGRRCIQATLTTSSWESFYNDDVIVWGCTAPASIEDLESIYKHHIDAAQRISKLIIRQHRHTNEALKQRKDAEAA